MLGFKSLEKKLRQGNGRAASATVLDIKKGRSINWTVKDPNVTSGGMTETVGTASKDHYKLRVEPDGEPPFEAEVVIREDQFMAFAPKVGSKIQVLFDPDDHSKLAVDVQATKQLLRPNAGRIDKLRAISADTSLSPEEKQAKIMELSAGPSARVFVGGQLAESGAPPGPAANVDALAKLAELRDRGVLTDEEFQAQKRRLLDE